jgi:hypothetical protein
MTKYDRPDPGLSQVQCETEDQPKMLLAATILLRERSATLAQSVNDPNLFGGGSIGSNRNQDSPLQKEMHPGVMSKSAERLQPPPRLRCT